MGPFRRSMGVGESHLRDTLRFKVKIVVLEEKTMAVTVILGCMLTLWDLSSQWCSSLHGRRECCPSGTAAWPFLMCTPAQWKNSCRCSTPNTQCKSTTANKAWQMQVSALCRWGSICGLLSFPASHFGLCALQLSCHQCLH